MAHIIVVVELATVVTIADKVEQLVAVASFPSPSQLSKQGVGESGNGKPLNSRHIGSQKDGPNN